MAFLPTNAADPFYLDRGAIEDLGRDLAPQYAGGTPFPHIVIDDFLPKPVLDYAIEHFPEAPDPETREFDRNQERYKRSFSPDYLDPRLRGLFYTFNSLPFLRVVENITGIEGLIPDPYFLGAGFHETRTGGHLSMHADFNHHVLMDVERRINLLIYLNPDWKEGYGGELELWETDMSRQVHSIVPAANRCVIFSTSEHSMHGHPEPVAHPDGLPRRSIALYYYTATWDKLGRRAKTTQFKPRAATTDKRDWEVYTREWMNEYLPPAVARRALNLTHKIRTRVR